MSCFGGRMQEYDRVSLDRFDGKNLQSTVYFLSHLHEDHTVGLGEKIFYKRLKTNKDIFLYCSAVTQVLLVSSKKYHHLEPYIKPLDISTPTTIVIPDPFYEEKETVTVTLLPAFHCPGSVMFLIEGKEGTVLYTGDFRWEHLDIEQMYHLRSGESVKKIQSLYVDTTFCSPESLHIPSRQQCMDAVCQLVQEWTSTSPKHIVNIYLRAQYGHEPLLHAVATRLNKKVHVNERKVAVYDRIHELHGIFTADGASTQLHACDKDCMIEVNGVMMLCREAHDPDKVLVILPTTMYFTQFLHLTLDKIVKKVSSNFFRACYSFHSSYTEVKDLLSYLKPLRVYPSVKPPADSSLAVTQHRLNTMLKECMESGAGEATQLEEIKVLGTLKTRSGRQVKKRKAKESTSDADSLDFGSPVKVARNSFSKSLETGEPASSSESPPVTKKGRGRGRGKGKSVTETTSQPAVGTRRSTRRSGAPITPEEHTPKKAKRSERSPTPELFGASDGGDQHSSFLGSERSDSELSLFSSQKSHDLTASGEASSSWTAGSFLAAVSSSSEDDAGTGRFCLLDDEEQVDEQFLDDSEFVDTEEEEEENCSDGNSRSVVEPSKEHDDNQRPLDEVIADACTGNTTNPSKLENVKNVNFKSEVASDKQQTAKGDISEIEHSVFSKTENNELEVSAKKIKSETKVDEDAQTGAETTKSDAVKIQSVEYTSEVQTRTEFKGDNLALKYLGTPVSKVTEYSSSSAESQTDKTLKKDEIPDHIVDSLDAESDSCKSELREELETHLTVAMHESEEHSKSFDDGPKNEEVVLLDIDSDEASEEVSEKVNAELGGGNKETGNDDIQQSKCDKELPAEVNIMIIDSDSDDVYENSMGEDELVRGKSKSKEDIIAEMDDYSEVVSSQQLNLPSCKNDESSKEEGRDLEKLPGQVDTSSCRPALSGVIEQDQLESGLSQGDIIQAAPELNSINKKDVIEIVQLIDDKRNTVPGSVEFESNKELDNDDQNQKLTEAHQLDENKEDDDVIEIVDLTGDEQLGESKTQNSLKPGKKTIKISLLSKQEPVKKIKKSFDTKSDEEEAKRQQISESESDEEIEISSSPEWLSVKKATGKNGRYVKAKAKKSKPKSRDLKNGNDKDLNDSRKTLKNGNNKEFNDSRKTFDSSANFSKKELEERNEVRRQALGFMCETDSDTDTDESSAHDSQTEDLLYDDYVELTSDSDNEVGLGGRNKGKKSFGRKSGNQKGADDSPNGSGGGRSGGSTQGWLSARKHTQASESEVQDIAVNKDKYTDFEEREMFSSEDSGKAVQGQTILAENLNNTGANVDTDKDNCLEQRTVENNCKDNSVTGYAAVTSLETCHEPDKVPLDVSEKNSDKDNDTSLNDDKNETGNVSLDQNREMQKLDYSDTENTGVILSVLENESSDTGSCAENPDIENLRQEQNEKKEDTGFASDLNEQPENIKKTFQSNILAEAQSSEKLTGDAAEHEFDKLKPNEAEPLNSQKNVNQELLKKNLNHVKTVAKVYSGKSQAVDTFGDQPPPPGTEDIHLPNNKIKKISSVISRRRSDKNYQPAPPPSTVTQASYPYNSAYVSEKTYPPGLPPPRPPLPHPAHPQPAPYNTQYGQQHFIPPVPVVQNLNPNWKQYESGSFPEKVIPQAPLHSFPPSGMPHSNVFIPPPVYNSPLPNVAYPPPVASTFIPTTSVVNVTTESSSSPVMAVKSKLKSAPLQQKKEDLIDKYMPCNSKKENKSVTKVISGKIQYKDEGLYSSQLARISQQNYQPTVESTDLNAIKANISALTGLSVSNLKTSSASTSTVKVSNKSQIEEIPELVDRLKKLEQMQTILKAVSGGTNPVATTGSEILKSPEITKGTFQYGHHLEPSESHGMQHNYTERQSDIDRRIRDKIHERQIRRSSYGYERRERHHEEREPRRSSYEVERDERNFDEREPRRPSYEYERGERFVERGPRRPIYENERRERVYDEREPRRSSYEYDEREPRGPSYEYERSERNHGEREPIRPSYEYERHKRNDERELGRPCSDFERERHFYFRGRTFDEREQRERSYLDHTRREREFERRYREEEDYRLWLEERKINEYCRRDVRRTPPRYGNHDDRRYNDTYYDEPSRYKDVEYEQWREERSYWEKERFESYHGLRPESLLGKPEPRVTHDSEMPRVGRDDTRSYYGNYDNEGFYDSSYDDKGPYVGRTDTFQEQKYVEEHASGQPSVTKGLWLEPVRKRQVVARVYSRSGQLISVQSAKEALHQAPALTKPEDKVENPDLPVFLTGMKYYETPTTQ